MAAAEQEHAESEGSSEPTGPAGNEPPSTESPPVAEGDEEPSSDGDESGTEPESTKEAQGAEEPEGSAAPTTRSRWWVPVAALAAAVVLLVLAAFPPWPDAWVAGEFGSVPWWVAAPALLGAAVLVGGLGGRRVDGGAAGAALIAAGLAVFVVVRDPSKDLGENPGWAEFLEPRPAAPLAAALAAVVAAGLCVVAAWRGVRLPPVREPGARSGRLARFRRLVRSEDAVRARGQRVLLVSLAGALVGTLLSAGAGVGADRVQRAFLDEAPFQADSETVSWGDRRDGHDVSFAEHYELITDLGLEEVAWQDTLAGPAELTTCVVRQPEAREDGSVPQENRGQPLVTRSTLVTVEEVPGGDAVVGYDPADGGERWRYTVEDGEVELPRYDSDEYTTFTDGVPSRIGQVGVTDFCAVHIVVDPVSLVTLDAATGEVRGESRLPSMTSGAWNDEEGTREDHWQFVTESRPADHSQENEHQAFDRLVPLGAGWDVHLEFDGQLAEVDRDTGELRALSTAESGCRHQVAYRQRAGGPGEATVLTGNCGSPTYQPVPLLPGDSSDLHEGASRVLADNHGVPLFGCEASQDWPDITDLRSRKSTLVMVGEWCDAFGTPLMVVIDPTLDDPADGVVELPEGTELPLRPHLVREGLSAVWLDRGTVYRHHYGIGGGEGRYEEMYADADGVEAMVTPEYEAEDHLASDAQRVFYAVTESGSILKLRYGQEFDEPDSLDSEVVQELDGVAGTCDGSRELVLDRPGLTLLALCETEEGTEVTAVSGERLSDPERIGEASFRRLY